MKKYRPPENPETSIVIPCHNHGRYIDDAVNSVLSRTARDVEIIIVDDGSTDGFTKEKLNDLEKAGLKVIRTENRGLANARNTGIKQAKGRYILPLDADDKIGPEYIEKAAKILDENPKTGIVYCEARFFGQAFGKWDLPPFSVYEMLIENIIFCSGLFRKTDWERAGGYDPEMSMGWEDYDFWLCILENGLTAKKIQEAMFFCRIRQNSMVRAAKKIEKAIMFEIIYNKHKDFFKAHIKNLIKGVFEFHKMFLPFVRLIKNARHILTVSFIKQNIKQNLVHLKEQKPGIVFMKFRIWLRENGFYPLYCLVILALFVKKRAERLILLNFC